MPRAAAPDQNEDSQKSCLELDNIDDSNDLNNNSPASKLSEESGASLNLCDSDLSPPPPRDVSNRTSIFGAGSALPRQAKEGDEPSKHLNLYCTPILPGSEDCDSSSIRVNHGSASSSPRGGGPGRAATVMPNVL